MRSRMMMAIMLGMSSTWAAGATNGNPIREQDAPLQRCEPRLRSAFWPGDANAHPARANQYAREGRLWICTSSRQGLKWEQIAINFKQLGAKRRPARANLLQ